MYIYTIYCTMISYHSMSYTCICIMHLRDAEGPGARQGGRQGAIDRRLEFRAGGDRQIDR